MQNRYSLWHYIVLGIILTVGVVYAIPNLYPETPVIQVSAVNSTVHVDSSTQVAIVNALKEASIPLQTIEKENLELVAHFASTDYQLKAQDVIKAVLGSNYTVALSLAPSTPKWLMFIHATP